MIFRRLLLAPIMPLLLCSQTAAGQPNAAPSATGSIEGTVLNAITGEPVSKASVSIAFSPAVGFRVGAIKFASTDSAGRFVVAGLAAGRYTLTASKPGFVRVPGSSTGSAAVAGGQQVTGVVLRLAPGGVVTGRIVDQEGDPVVRAPVALLRKAAYTGKWLVQQVSSESTNDLGEYRFFDISPGRYFVSASPQARGRTAEEQDYTLTYYPGVVMEASAQELEVRAGNHTESVNFALRKARVLRVSGRVSGKESGNVEVTISLRGNKSEASLIARTIVSGENRSFILDGLAPGSYIVFARQFLPAAIRSAATQVELGSTDVENLNLVFSPLIAVTGKLRVEGSDTLPEQLPISFVQRDPERRGREDLQMLRGAGGSFQMPNASPDVYSVRLNSRTVYVKRIRVGSKATSSPVLDLSGSAGVADVEILLANNPPGVAGSVRNLKTGQPAVGALVVLIPNEPERKEDDYFYRVGSSDALGRFDFRGELFPGSYTAFAWQDGDAAAYREPDFMKQFEGKGVAVDLSEGNTSEIQLTLLTADSGAQ